jgi:hypothetical protein
MLVGTQRQRHVRIVTCHRYVKVIYMYTLLAFYGSRFGQIHNKWLRLPSAR